MPGWDPFVYVKDLQHTAGQGNFMLRIFVRDSADPLLFARNATRKEQPAFGDRCVSNGYLLVYII
jgi:hypothetical protein